MQSWPKVIHNAITIINIWQPMVYEYYLLNIIFYNMPHNIAVTLILIT